MLNLIPVDECFGSLKIQILYTLSEAWSGVNWADLMAAFGTDFYDRSILRPKHRAYYCSGRPVIKIGPKGDLGSHEILPIHSAPSLGQSIAACGALCFSVLFRVLFEFFTITSTIRKFEPEKMYLKCVLENSK